ncbi:hypothetical protein HK104_008187 [Borealophlyctis nickersoniae]|nr:hypothetical protein HK104_008187 [Borealophlyctis nickersoniae]
MAAFVARSGLPITDPNVLREALTHTSCRRTDPNSGFERLHMLGEKVLSLYATEYVQSRYPRLPADIVENVANSYVGQRALMDVGTTLGVHQVMRWKGNAEEGSRPDGQSAVTGGVMQALIGALYQDKGAKVTRQYVSAHFLSRAVDMDAHFKLANPKYLLNKIVEQKGQPRPVARLLKETGRLSRTPVFIVGMYSGILKIGEGYGSSMKMAEIRAVKDALQKHYMTEVKEVTVPSEVDEDGITFFEEKEPSS